MSHINLAPYESRVLYFIIRKTYGWHKKSDLIPLSQIVQSVGIVKSNASRALKHLITKGIVIRLDNKQIGFNKDYSQWQIQKLSVPITVISSDNSQIQADSKVISSDNCKKLSVPITEVINLDNKKLSVQDTSKETTKETIQKKDIYIRVFNHWNSFKIITHKKLTDNMNKAIDKALKNYSQEDIEKSISNYSQCRKENPKIYPWTLEEFCNRSIDKFLDLEVARQKYEFLRERNNQKFIPGKLPVIKYKTVAEQGGPE